MFDADLTAGHVPGFFKDVVFSATGDLEDKVSEALTLGGAKKMNYLTGNSTHCIVGNNPDQNDIVEATEMLDVPAVNQSWVLASLHCKHILPIKAFSPTAKLVLRGVTVCADESILAPDVDILWALVTYNGGNFTKVWKSGVTHVLATNARSQLYKKIFASKESALVTPDWLSDCVTRGNRQSEAIYHPRLLIAPENLPKPVFQSKSEIDKVTAQTGKIGLTGGASGTGTPRMTGPAAGGATPRLPPPPTLGATPRLPGPPTVPSSPATRPTAVRPQRPQMAPRLTTPAVATTSTTAQQQKQTTTISTTTTQSSTVSQASTTSIATTTSSSLTTSAPAPVTPTIIQSTMPISAQHQQQQLQQQSGNNSTVANTTPSTSGGSTVVTPTLVQPGTNSSVTTTSGQTMTPPVQTAISSNSTSSTAVQSTASSSSGGGSGANILVHTNTTISSGPTVMASNTLNQAASSVPSSNTTTSALTAATTGPASSTTGAAALNTTTMTTASNIVVGANQSIRPQQSPVKPPPTSAIGNKISAPGTMVTARPPLVQAGGVVGGPRMPQQQPTALQQQNKPLQGNVVQTPPGGTVTSGTATTSGTLTTTSVGNNTNTTTMGSSTASTTTPQTISGTSTTAVTSGGTPAATAIGVNSSAANVPVMTTAVATTGNNSMTTFQQQQMVVRGGMQQQQLRPTGAAGMTGMVSGQQFIRIQNGQQVTLQQPQQQQGSQQQQQGGQPQQPVSLQQGGQPQQQQQLRMQNPQQQMGLRQGHPAILQQHEQNRMQQGPGGQQMQQQHMQQQGQQQWTQGGVMQSQPGQGQPTTVQQQQMQQQQWNQQQNPQMMQQGMPGRMIGPGGRPGLRQMTPHFQKQHIQQLIQQHLLQLTPEQRQQFNSMNPKEKQQYLAQKGLLLPPAGWGGQTVQLQRQPHTIQLTEQQKQMLQNMNMQDKNLFIQKLSREREAQVRAQMQMQQQNMMAQQQNMMSQQQQMNPHQMAQNQQTMQQNMMQQNMASPATSTGGAVSSQQQPWQQQQGGSPVPSSPGGATTPGGGQPPPVSPMQQQHPNMSPGGAASAPGSTQQQRMASPASQVSSTPTATATTTPTAVSAAGQQIIRGTSVPPTGGGGGVAAWSGETHPALAQVPRTPQQIQHMQRLQLQRQQQLAAAASAGGGGGPAAVGGGTGGGGDLNNPDNKTGVGVVVSGAAGDMQQQHIIGPNGQSQTKVALQNMLSSRLGPGGQPLPPGAAAGPQQGGAPPGSVVQQTADPSGRMQMMGQPGAGGMMPQQQHILQQQQMLAMQQQRSNALRNVTNVSAQQQQHMAMVGGKPVSMAGAGPRFGGPRHAGPGGAGMVSVAGGGTIRGGVVVPPSPGAGGGGGATVVVSGGIPPPGVAVSGGLPPGHPHGGVGMPPRIPPQFIGHHIETRLPPDLCLLGCIFVVTDYQDSEEKSKYVASWKKTITQYGGEIEGVLSPRVTHLLCSSQKSPLAQQARIEGKRLVTCFWLNDTIRKKKVMPPWKAIHFPLPAQFEPPCTNMILCLTGFQERDRDYVKEMITIVGAKYTGYFSKHNHAIICKAPVGEKYEKAREWKVPVVSVQWLNDVMFGSVNAAQCMSNSKYQGFKSDDPLRIDYNLVPHLIAAWKQPGIRVTPETYQKFKANPPARIKRKADKQRMERETEEKRRRMNEERAAQGLPPLDIGCFNSMELGETDLDPVTGLPVPRPPAPPPVQKKEGEGGDTNGIKKEVDEEKENNPFKLSDGGVHKIMFTNMESRTRMELNDLLVDMCTEYTDDAMDATHLIMPKLGRTNNFLLALPSVKYIVTPDWIRKSKAARKWLPEQDFIVKDPKFEEAHNCNIGRLLKNPERNKVFHGKVFYITPSVQPSMKMVVNLVQAAGGRVENRRIKTPQQIKEMNKGGVMNYIIITCEDDLHLVTEVLRAKHHIFTPEFVFSAVLQCEMDFDVSRYVTTVNHTENEV